MIMRFSTMEATLKVFTASDFLCSDFQILSDERNYADEVQYKGPDYGCPQHTINKLRTYV